jgi:hypothetical protein
MRWTFVYSGHGNFVRVIVEGSFNLADHERKIEELTGQDYWLPGIKVLLDLREADSTHMSYKDMRGLADSYASNERLADCWKFALLMGKLADFGIGRQFEILTDEKIPGEIKVFLDEGQAIHWLGD